MAVEILVGDICAIAVEDTEASPEIPECPAPTRFTPVGQAVLHPAKHHVVPPSACAAIAHRATVIIMCGMRIM